MHGQNNKCMDRTTNAWTEVDLFSALFDLLGSIYVRETVFLNVKIIKMRMVDENPQKLGKLTQLASTRLIGKVNGHWES